MRSDQTSWNRLCSIFAALLTFVGPRPASAHFDFGTVFQRAQMSGSDS